MSAVSTTVRRRTRRAGWLLTVLLFVAGTVGVFTPPPPAQADEVTNPYFTPGIHDINGRRWQTWCEPYSSNVTRCWTEIVSGGKWVFNNLSYVGAGEGSWVGNPLASTGDWTAADGRRWSTECNTARSGRGGCRSYIATRLGWVFNSTVLFTYSGSMPSTTWRPSKQTGGSATYAPAKQKAPAAPKVSQWGGSEWQNRGAMPALTGKSWTIRLRTNTVSSQKQIDQCSNTPSMWQNYRWVVSHNYCNGWEANVWHQMRRGDRVTVLSPAGSTVMSGVVDHDFSLAYGLRAPVSEAVPVRGEDFFWVQVSWPDNIRKDTNHVIVVRAS